MSYRAFKRLLGETSLERKCRFLFGAGILLLLTASFWWYAHQTEKLAYTQAAMTTCRLLATESFRREYLKTRLNEKEFQKLEDLSKENMPNTLPDYWSEIIIPKASHRLDNEEAKLIKEFQNEPDKNEDWQVIKARVGEESPSIHFYGAMRAPKGGLANLRLTDEEREAYGDIQEKDLL